MPNQQVTGGVQVRFEEALSAVQRVVGELCRRKGLVREEAEDFESWVMLKLIENDYSRFRKFRGDSTLQTYLTTVVARLLLDYRREKWGKWRPSAKAKRLGDVATSLEALVYRDGMSFREACQTMLSSVSSLEEEGLASLMANIPVRHRAVHVPADLVDLPETTPTTWLVDKRDARYTGATIQSALAAKIRLMSPRDRLILKLRFVGGLTVREIAEVLGLRARWLYRHLGKLLDSLRFVLSDAGVRRDGVRALEDHASLDIDLLMASGAGQLEPGTRALGAPSAPG